MQSAWRSAASWASSLQRLAGSGNLPEQRLPVLACHLQPDVVEIIGAALESQLFGFLDQIFIGMAGCSWRLAHSTRQEQTSCTR